MTRLTVALDERVDAADARVIVVVGPDGAVLEASLEQAGLPRIEPMLLGRPVTDVVRIVERVCGLCPAAHHLAGIRALEAALGIGAVPPTADAVRRLLHHGTVLVNHLDALAMELPGRLDPDAMAALRALGAGAVRAAGGPGHFPACAVVGGVAAAVDPAVRDGLAAVVGPAPAAAAALVEAVACSAGGSSHAGGSGHAGGAGHGASSVGYGSAASVGDDVCLVDAAGGLDLLGDRLRVVGPDGAVRHDGVPAGAWRDLVRESRPGSPTARPLLVGPDGTWRPYRVGPIAQLRAADRLPGDGADAARRRWLAGGGGPAWARAVIVLHAAEVIADLVGRPELVAGSLPAGSLPAGSLVADGAPAASSAGGPSGVGAVGAPPSGVGTGLVDGARGLLGHWYRIDASGVVTDASITTPTLQNEPWLAELLAASLRGAGLEWRGSGPDPAAAERVENHGPASAWSALAAELEAAVRAADPCVPCVAQPAGWMQLTLDVRDARGRRVLERQLPAPAGGLDE